MSFLEEDGTNLNYNVDLNEVGHSQLDAADINVGYNMQYDSNQTYPMSEDSYPVLFSTDNTTRSRRSSPTSQLVHLMRYQLTQY